MYRRLSISSAALAALVAVSGPAVAASRDPLVVQGVSAGSTDDPFSERARAHGGRQPAAALPIREPLRRQTRQQPARGQYGGGFIEFLITGGGISDPTPAPAPLLRREHRSQSLTTRQASIAPVPAFRQSLSRTLDPRYERQEVAYSGKHGAGTIVVDTPNRFLYLVLGNGRALRYGIGVGRPGFEWSGMKRVTRKAEWPGWTPPPEMRKRRPDLPSHMPGGPENPLGARALYLGSSLYRIHGTNEPETIGTNVSSGCIRLLNEDVKDLYQRVRVGTKVIVI